MELIAKTLGLDASRDASSIEIRERQLSEDHG